MTNNLNQKISIDEINHIDIKVKEGVISIYETQEDEIIVQGKGGNLFKQLLVYKEDDKILVLQKKVYFPINILIMQTKISIGIPKKFKKNISIKNSTGSVIINDIYASSISVSSNAGSIKINNVMFEHLNVRVGTRGCNISLKDKSGDIIIKSMVGKVNLYVNEVGGNLTLKAGTRGAAITVPKNAPIKINEVNNNKLKIYADVNLDAKFIYNLKPNVGIIKVVNV